MGISFDTFKYLLLLVVIIGWFYFRLMRSMKKRGKLHGPHLWRESLRERRRERLRSAETWEERREIKSGIDPERRIAQRYLNDKSGERGSGEGSADGLGREERE
jgi:hypothetical protein